MRLAQAHILGRSQDSNEPRRAMARTAGSGQRSEGNVRQFQCKICHEELERAEGDEEGIEFLVCGHTFCSECLNTHLRTHGLTEETVPCPVCRMTQQQARAIERGLLAAEEGAEVNGQKKHTNNKYGKQES